MKLKAFLTVVSLITTFVAFGQKEVKDTPVSEDSKLTISAKAESLTDVVFTITPTVTFDKDKVGFSFPYEIKVAPLNQKTFKDNLMEALLKIASYQQDTETLKTLKDSLGDTLEEDLVKNATEVLLKLLSKEQKETLFDKENVTETELGDLLKSNDKTTEIKKVVDELLAVRIESPLSADLYGNFEKILGKTVDTNYYEAKAKIDNRLNALFRHFDGQLVLLFEFDNEPIAGTLYYNKEVKGVQYFTDRSYKTYFVNRKKNYHRLIRKLFRIRRDNRTTTKKGMSKSTLIDVILNSPKTQDSIMGVIDHRIALIKELFNNKGLDGEYDEFIRFRDHLKNTQVENKFYSCLTKNEIRTIIEEAIEDEVKESHEEDRPTESAMKNERDDNLANILEIFSKDVQAATREKEKIFDNIMAAEKVRLEKYYEDDVRYAQDVTTISHFTKTRKEFKNKYRNDPVVFYDNFKSIIENFRVYRRVKRLDWIYEELLRLKNKEVYEELATLSDDYLLLEQDISKLDKDTEYVYKKTKFFEDLESLRRAIGYLKKMDEEDRPYTIAGTKTYLENDSDTISERYVNIKELFDEIYDSTKNVSLKKEIRSKVDDILHMLNNNKFLIKNPFDKIFYEDLHSMEISAIIDKYLSETNKSLLWLANEKQKNGGKRKVFVDTLEGIKGQITQELKKAPLWDFEAENMELDLNDGFAEHIVVYGKISGLSPIDEENKGVNALLDSILKGSSGAKTNYDRSLKFTNEFPYGFSANKDYDAFKDYDLSVYYGKDPQFEVKVEKVFPNYVQKLANDRLDFSPRDQVVSIAIKDGDKPKDNKVTLKKEVSSKLFNVAVYTDFVGFANEPNGVAQMELNKLIPLYTKRKTNHFWQRYLGAGFNFGKLNYITPQVRWARLNSGDDEENLPLSFADSFDGQTASRLPFVTTLNLLRYENVSVGADLNLVSLDFPTSKLRFEMNFGGRYGRTKVLDTNGEEISITADTTNVIGGPFSVNTWRYYPEFMFRLRPEERYGANVSFRPMRFNTVTTDFSTVSSEEDFRETLMDSNQWLHQIEINAHFSPSGRNDNKFFFRYRYTNNARWETNGYSEIQVGYSMSLRVPNRSRGE